MFPHPPASQPSTSPESASQKVRQPSGDSAYALAIVLVFAKNLADLVLIAVRMAMADVKVK